MPTVIDYLQFGLWLTSQQLLLVFAPLFLMAFFMHLSSSLVRKQFSYLLSARAYVLFTFIGVICHELGHAIFCLLFGHKLEKVKLIQIKENAPLGYVTHSYKKGSVIALIGNFFIGTGPIWFGAILILVLSQYLLSGQIPLLRNDIQIPDKSLATIQGLEEYLLLIYEQIRTIIYSIKLKHFYSIVFWIWLYLSFSIGSHMSLSKIDIRSASKGFMVLILCLCVFNLITANWIGDESLIISTMLGSYVFVIVVVLALIIAINCVLAGALLVLSGIKRIIV